MLSDDELDDVMLRFLGAHAEEAGTPLPITAYDVHERMTTPEDDARFAQAAQQAQQDRKQKALYLRNAGLISAETYSQQMSDIRVAEYAARFIA